MFLKTRYLFKQKPCVLKRSTMHVFVHGWKFESCRSTHLLEWLQGLSEILRHTVPLWRHFVQLRLRLLQCFLQKVTATAWHTGGHRGWYSFTNRFSQSKTSTPPELIWHWMSTHFLLACSAICCIKLWTSFSRSFTPFSDICSLSLLSNNSTVQVDNSSWVLSNWNENSNLFSDKILQFFQLQTVQHKRQLMLCN